MGFVVGSVLGAFIAEYIYQSSVLTPLGTFLGMILGATIGSRLRSTVFQFIWIEYSRRMSIRYAIMQLDEVLRGVQMNAIVTGYVLTLFIVMAFALINQFYPITSNWLVTFLIVLPTFLIGRFLSAWKYR